MKKHILSALAMAAVCLSAGAQTMMDALNVSQNNYYGTARTMGMGNAVTAVGADLGSVGINPAGSAVAGYSQFTITPGLTISSTGSAYAPSFAPSLDGQYGLPSSQTFGNEYKSSRTRFNIPNVGLMLRFDTGRDYGVRAFTFGIVSNGTSNFTDDVVSGGINRGTSITGAFAAFSTINANGRGSTMPGEILSWKAPFDSDYYWNYVAAYWGGLINHNFDAGTYFGSAETVVHNPDGTYNYFVKGDLDHKYSTQSYGTKNDIVINFALDINDNLFLGLNLGLPVMDYRYNQSFVESAHSDPETDFVYMPEYIDSKGDYRYGPRSYFDQAKYQYSSYTSVSGVYGKLGLIALPTENLRIGAAFQTPVSYSIRETWQIREECSSYEADMRTGRAGAYVTGYSNSPDGEYRYRLRGPYSFNAGLAYTFGTMGLLSVDYELTDFSVMQYRNQYGAMDNNFTRVNRLNNLFCGVSHSVRAGLEVKPIPFLALRAGFSFKSDPTCYHTDLDGEMVDAYTYDAFYDDFERGYFTITDKKNYFSDNVWAVSAGLGYISLGSFFADLAVRMSAFPTTYTEPYSQYLDGPVYSPSICSKRNLWDVLFTLGWRF